MKALDIHVHTPWVTLAQRPDDELAEMKRRARESGIEKVLLLTWGSGTPEQIRELNECTLRLAQEDPGFFLGGMYLSPLHDPAFIREEATRCARAGMVAIKQLLEANARDPRVDPIAEVAAELDIPIVYHAWYKMVDKYPNECDGSDIADLARRHPDTRFVMAHLTGVGRRGVQDIEDLPNVYVETSGGWYEAGLVEYAVRRLGAGRVLFGSDYPGREYAAQLGRVLGADIPKVVKEQILWHNSAALLQGQ